MLLPRLNYTLVDTPEKVTRCLRNIQRAEAVTFDCETTGLLDVVFDKDAAVNILSIGTHNRQWVIPLDIKHGKQVRNPWHKKKDVQQDIVERVKEQIDEVPEVIAQNGKFDNLWLYHMFGIRFKLTFDTMLAKHLFDENNPTSLSWNIENVLGRPDNDTITLDEKKGKYGLTRRLIHYAAQDAHYTWLLFYRYLEWFEEDESLWNLFEVEVMPAARAYEQIEINGIYLDFEQHNKVDTEVTAKIAKCEEKLLSYADINWGSTQQVGRYLFEEEDIEPEELTAKGNPSTSEDNLKKLLAKDAHPCIKHLMEYRGLKQKKSFFIDGWRKRVYQDYWLHPKYKINGTVTGRPSCEDPNIQQTPRDPLIRSLIGAPPGWIAWEADYSQIELRVVALLAQERTMLYIFQTGGDIHEETYQSIMGCSTQDAVAHIRNPAKRKAQQKEERKKAKAINFGFIYGMGWKKFMEYALSKYDLVFSPRESQNIRRRYFEKYSDLPAFHDRQRRLVRNNGMVHTLTGRIRHLPTVYSSVEYKRAEAERQAINSPVQGFGAEMTLLALPEIIALDPEQEDLKVCGTIHDATIGRVRESHIEMLQDVRRVMVHPSGLDKLNIDLDVPILVDVEVGNWSVGKPLEEVI